jgi:two-component system, response regulator
MKKETPVTILIAEDDPDDQLLCQDAMTQSKAEYSIKFVENGQEVMDYLRHTGSFEGANKAPRPSLIILDLNMPKKDGRQALKEIKADPDFRSIPVVVLTTSSADSDIRRTYELGVNSYITKPASFDALVQLMGTLTKYWLKTVRLPDGVR